jgi:hypothetical protein
MGPNTVYIMVGAGVLILAVIVFLVYKSIKGQKSTS